MVVVEVLMMMVAVVIVVVVLQGLASLAISPSSPPTFTATYCAKKTCWNSSPYGPLGRFGLNGFESAPSPFASISPKNAQDHHGFLARAEAGSGVE